MCSTSPLVTSRCGVQAPLHSVATHDASTQLPLTEFFIGCIFSNDPLDRQASPSAHCDADSASPPQPADIATLCSPSSASHASDGHEDTTAPCVVPQPPPGLERYSHLCNTHGIPVKAAPVRPRLCTSISVTPPQSHVSTTQVGTHPVRSATTYKRSASTALAGTHNPVGADPRAGTGPFPKPQALVLPMVKFGQFKPDGLGHIDTPDSDLMHHQYRLSVLQWNPGPARRNPTTIIAAACGRFHAVILQEASDHVPHISDQFIAYTGNTDLAILLNKDTFEHDPMVLAFKEDSSKSTWGMVLLIVRALLRRPSLAGTPTVTFLLSTHSQCCGQERDASTELLQRLHGYMKQHNVDLVGGDFNMSALSTVGDVFSDPVFSAPGNSFLWRLGALDEQNRECTDFLIMPKRPYEWRVDSHGRCKFDKAALGFGPRDQSAHLPVFLHLRTTNLPGPSSIMRSEHAQQRRMERMTVREEDVHDCDPVRQGHVSAFLVTSSEFARESLASQLCLPTALAHGRFASSICLCLCLCQTNFHMRKHLQMGQTRSARSTLPATEQSQNQAAHQQPSHQPWTPANAGT